MDASEIDWETINEQMPYDHSEESHARRREIWNGMNVNGNKFLSLAEVDKGVIDVRRNKIITLERSHLCLTTVQVLGLEDVFDSKRAINEAFYFAKNSSPVSNMKIINTKIEITVLSYRVTANMAMIIWSSESSDCFSKPCEQLLSFIKPSTSSTWREITGSLKKSFVTKTSSKMMMITTRLTPTNSP